MDNKQILAQIKNIEEHSAAYQRIYGVHALDPKDEIGGHIGYDLQEAEDRLSPSDEFMNSLFEACAAGLGFEYERR